MVQEIFFWRPVPELQIPLKIGLGSLLFSERFSLLTDLAEMVLIRRLNILCPKLGKCGNSKSSAIPFFGGLNIPALIKNSSSLPSFSLFSKSLLRKVLILWQFALQERFLLILAHAIFAVYLNKKLTQGQKAILIVGQDIFFFSFFSECKHSILAKVTQNREGLR